MGNLESRSFLSCDSLDCHNAVKLFGRKRYLIAGPYGIEHEAILNLELRGGVISLDPTYHLT